MTAANYHAPKFKYPARMKRIAIIIALSISLTVGFCAGSFFARLRARAAVLSGPYSDNYGPALAAIADAKAKVHGGDTKVLEPLQTAETHIQAAQTWSRRFLGTE